MDYFTLNQEKIFIEIKDLNIILKKYINRVLTELNENQKKEILKKLQSKNGYIYETKMLEEIMQTNLILNSDFDYYYDFLSYIERVIPDKYKANYYNNLKTLQIELNLDVEPTNTINNKLYITHGSYNIINNKIIMNPESISKIREISMDTENPNNYFWKHFNKNLLHELFHMASVRFDKETGETLSGFNRYPAKNNLDYNMGLTEGMTEILACCGIPGTSEVPCAYYIEEMFINQLTQIIGVQPLIDSYFGNLGVNKLCEKLCEIDDNTSEANSLFILLDLNYWLKEKSDKQTLLGTVQAKLVEYYSKKIYMDIKKRVPEAEIKKSMDMYKSMLVTEEILNAMKN